MNDISGEVKKEVAINTAYSNEPGMHPINKIPDRRKRGLNVYTTTQIINATGRDQEGRLISWGTEQPYFYLTIDQRINMAKLSAPVFGVISGRMNRISSIDFSVESEKDTEDRIVDDLKSLKSMYDEYKPFEDIKYAMVKANLVKKMKETLIDIFPNMSNFNGSLLRWKKKIKNTQNQSAEEIKEWLLEPNTGVTWQTYVKKLIFDLHVHGCVATYKKSENGRLENFDTLPGGSVYKLRNPYFSAMSGYLQIIPGYETQIFWENEISFMEWYPISGLNYPLIPLECLINKISESLLFDRLMAEQADGTKPPEKLVIVTNPNSFGDFDKEENIPLDQDEMKRIETKLNEPKQYAVITMSGNKAEVIDLTKENTMGVQSARQKDIREDVAFVFNATNLEVNLTGGDDTSGRSTAEEQSEISMAKGINPILTQIEAKINRDILPMRYGHGWKIEFSKVKNDMKQEQVDALRLANGKVTINELREEENKPTFADSEYDMPQGFQKQIPDGSSISPFNFKQMK